jgi:hypothetical protein
VPRRGSFTSDISPPLHLGQRCWTGNVVAPHAPQRLPISCGFSSGQVEISGASAFCGVDTRLTLIGNAILV